MAIFHSNAIPAGSTGYEIEYSCRFNDDSNHYMERTPSSDGNRTTWTVSFWCKRGTLHDVVPSNQYIIFGANNNDARICFTEDDNGDGFRVVETGRFELITKTKKRDIAQWYHFVVQYDSTQGTSSDRIKIYENGTRIPTGGSHWHIENYPSQNLEARLFTDDIVQQIGKSPQYTRYWDGYLAEVHFVDGQALTSADFGEVDEDYGHWKPKKYTGSHGTNGFHLDFSNASSLGNDNAGSNNWTVYNLSTHDQVTDTPTNNFAVMNNLNNQPFVTTFAEGNLEITTGGSQQEPSNMATMGMSSGKWYFEVYQKSGGSDALLGIRSQQPGTISPTAKDNPGKSVDGYALYANITAGNLVHNNAYVSYGNLIGYTNGDIISIAVDLDNNKCYWAKNGTWLNSANPASNSNGHSITAAGSTRTGEYFPCFGDYDANSYVLVTNFGQDGTFAGNLAAGGNSDSESIGNFKYAVPSGFKALCSKNLPDPDVIPSEHFNTVLWTGNASSNRAISTGLSNVDMVWIKGRSNADDHRLGDTVRGGNPTEHLKTNDSSSAVTNGTTVIKSISGGNFNVGSDGSVNGSSRTYAAWCWKMNGSGSSNSNGSTTSTVSANAAAGQSIVTYSGASGNGTVGHGLSKAPNLVIVKSRNASDQWRVGSIQTLDSMDFTDYLRLNDAGGKSDESTTWKDTAPTSTVISVGTDSATNHPGYTYVAYCFHDVEGYSKIGCYSGNGSSSDGTFVYCGFRPQWLLLKPSNYGDGWKLWDTTRGAQNGPYNQYPPGDLKPNQPNIENFSTSFNLDFYCNGFKWRASDNSVNGGYNYLYYAIAEQPFKYSNAR